MIASHPPTNPEYHYDRMCTKDYLTQSWTIWHLSWIYQIYIEFDMRHWNINTNYLTLFFIALLLLLMFFFFPKGGLGRISKTFQTKTIQQYYTETVRDRETWAWELFSSLGWESTATKQTWINMLVLTLLRIDLFGAAHGWWRGAKRAPFLKSVTNIL